MPRFLVRHGWLCKAWGVPGETVIHFREDLLAFGSLHFEDCCSVLIIEKGNTCIWLGLLVDYIRAEQTQSREPFVAPGILNLDCRESPCSSVPLAHQTFGAICSPEFSREQISSCLKLTPSYPYQKKIQKLNQRQKLGQGHEVLPVHQQVQSLHFSQQSPASRDDLQFLRSHDLPLELVRSFWN